MIKKQVIKQFGKYCDLDSLEELGNELVKKTTDSKLLKQFYQRKNLIITVNEFEKMIDMALKKKWPLFSG